MGDERVVQVHQEIGRVWAETLSREMRSVVDCDYSGVEETTYGEYAKTLSGPGCFVRFWVSAVEKPVLLSIALPTAYAVIDRYYGGRGENPPSEARPLSAAECRAIEGVVGPLLSGFAEVWGKRGVSFEVIRPDIESDPGHVGLANAGDAVTVVSFEVHSQHSSGITSLCYPAVTLDPMLEMAGVLPLTEQSMPSESSETTGEAESASDPSESGFYLMRELDPGVIVPMMLKEHPQTIALVISKLDARQAAGVLEGLPDAMQGDIIRRIATMDSIPPQALRDLEASLAVELGKMGLVTEVGGPKAVAAILNRAGRSTEKEILVWLDGEDPELCEDVRNQMFVFDDIAHLTDRDLQKVLKEVERKDLAVSLKGGSEEMKERVFANVADAEKLKEEMTYSGPVRMSDVEEVQLAVVKVVRQLEQAGEIRVVRGDGDKFV